MKDFLSLRFSTQLDEQAICDQLTTGLPSFTWRRGDSDAQGPYIAGIDQSSVQIKCWMGERPMDVTASFRSAWSDSENRHERKQEKMQQLLQLLRSFGEVDETTETD